LGIGKLSSCATSSSWRHRWFRQACAFVDAQHRIRIVSEFEAEKYADASSGFESIRAERRVCCCLLPVDATAFTSPARVLVSCPSRMLDDSRDVSIDGAWRMVVGVDM
jgi:hypothetical protein